MQHLAAAIATFFLLGPIAAFAFSYTPLGRALVDRLKSRAGDADPRFLDFNAVSFTAALLVTSLVIFSIGFVIASMVPTARFAQPLGTIILYPMLALSGIFVPLSSFPPALRVVGEVLPMSHAVSLLRATWAGASWLDHTGDLVVLSLYFVLFSALSAKVFRWE